MFLGLFGVQISALSSENATTSNELWVLVKTDTYFRTNREIELVDAITEVVERKNLGELDGHSSGGNQFDFNYVDVINFSQTKAVIEKELKESYPQLTFSISKEYETKFESP